MSFQEWPAWSAPEQLRRILAKLPPIARTKFQKLQSMSADAEALINSAIAQQAPLQIALDDLGQRRGYLDVKKEPEAAAALECEMTELLAQHRRLDQERSARQATKQNLDQTISSLREVFLLGGKLTWPVHAVHVDARPQEGEDLPTAILRVRREISVAQGELRAARAAPGDLEELGVEVLMEIERKAQRGRPRVNINAGKVSINWPDTVALGPRNTVIGAPQGAASDQLCWLFQKEVSQKLVADLVDQQREGGSTGITESERAARIVEIEHDIARLEHMEECLIEQAIDAGLEVHRRVNASPWALLSIEAGAEVPVMVAAE
jgi:hypothetical protein